MGGRKRRPAVHVHAFDRKERNLRATVMSTLREGWRNQWYYVHASHLGAEFKSESIHTDL
jgi:hypothetical protein